MENQINSQSMIFRLFETKFFWKNHGGGTQFSDYFHSFKDGSLLMNALAYNHDTI